MRDMFDDFLEELRRREAEARGEEPEERPPRRPRPVGPDGPDGGRRPRRFRASWWVVILVVIVTFFVASAVLDLWTDALWFQSVGFDVVFWTRFGAQLGLFVVAALGSLAIILINLSLAGRLSPPSGGGASFSGWFERLNDATGSRRVGGASDGGPRTISFGPEDVPDLTPIARAILVVVAVLVALTIGASVAASWETILLWANRVPFSPEGAAPVVDPVFGRDIGFFLFDLPFLRLVQSLFNAIVIASLVAVGIRYLVAATRGNLELTTQIRVHLGILAGLFLLSIAFGYQLDKFELAYSGRGFVTGVSYTDQNAQFFAYDVLTVLSGLAGALLVGAAFTRMLWPLGLTLGVWLLASLLIGRAYPEAIQRLTVDPNQFAQEERYISNNIAMTRLAFGLDGWDDDRPFRGEAVLSQQVIENEAATFRNARLWDYRPLAQSLDQLQTVRRYYDFVDVDTDRYEIDGEQRQVMLSARELALDQNPGATGWVNQRVNFTHGIGATMVPVNEVANEGQPRLLIGNLPPVSAPGAPTIREPRIYFGERDSSYIVVGARQNEFDYPTGEGDETGAAGTSTRWTGTSGIRIDTTLMRALFALRFRDLDLLITDQVTDQSQLLFHRSLRDRLGQIAPFLLYDKDPYLVIDDSGRLVYVQDAYTASDRFPHAQGFDPRSAFETTGLGRQPFNYLRNSVKLTMDAYDGTMRFYIADPQDPIVRAYAGVFPSLFRPMSELPDDLLPHLRVPEEQFNVQTRVFGRYHVTSAEQFFRNDDQWTVPQGQTSEQALPSEAYYVIMRMPGEEESEFLLLQPMVPISRPNMIAWVAARMDKPNYGATRIYRFPAETTIFGPAQIEARIDQDPAISQQLTLWRNSGSNVIRGNLIVVPITDSILYLQPVYLQSTGSAFPEFRRIVVASPREVVWAETLASALDQLLEAEGGTAGPSPAPTPRPTTGPTPSPTTSPDPDAPLPADVPGLIEYANQHFELAQAALQDGDFGRYGDEIAKVEAALRRLDELAPGLASPSPAP
jgi:uncharacterized protein